MKTIKKNNNTNNNYCKICDCCFNSKTLIQKHKLTSKYIINFY